MFERMRRWVMGRREPAREEGAQQMAVGVVCRDDRELAPQCLTLLIVEDNVFLRDIMRSYFLKLGASVDVAEDGQTGLERYVEGPDRYDAIFMDIQMPTMDGYEAAKRIRASGTPTARTIPIIAVSGTVPFDGTRADEFTACIKKPFEMDQLPLILHRVLHGREVRA